MKESSFNKLENNATKGEPTHYEQFPHLSQILFASDASTTDFLEHDGMSLYIWYKCFIYVSKYVTSE